ncbi:hypothetical protein [Micromonospora sp. NPDC000442]|uniref:hypothetical protein n=1 Tax=Micromonospora sp. NPDC000442 TaxID=3364217 RepID=UPI00367B2804
MRALDPSDRDVPAHPARPSQSGTDPAAQTGAVAALLALHGRAGNAAVTRQIQRQRSGRDTCEGHARHEHGGGHRPGSVSGLPTVQRVTDDELHREPPGPSVQVRGPRRSFSSRRASAQVDRQTWEQMSNAYQAVTGQTPVKERISLDTDLTSLSEMSPPVAGHQLGTALTNVAQHVGISLVGGVTGARSNAEMMEELGRRDPVSRPYWEAQDARDQRLAGDAVTRAARYQQGSGAENAQARRDATAGMLRGIPMPAADATDMLLLANDGLVIGGPHYAEPFFAWVNDHMARLRQNGVRTLYLEAIRDDVHQHLVDSYLSTGVMSPELVNFCNTYQRGHAVDLAAFLETAHETGMRVKGTGGRPARRFGTNIHRRAVMQNTYGEQVVRRDRAQSVAQGEDPGKYLLQAGEAHARTHDNTQPTPTVVGGAALPDQFPGINELLDVPAVRLEDNLDGSKRLRPV